jgi:hypothetical protein
MTPKTDKYDWFGQNPSSPGANGPEETHRSKNQEVPAGPELLSDIERFIRCYLVLPAAAYLTLALWALATHAVHAFDCFPYVSVLSAVKRCGKTRLAEVLETLVREPWRGTAPSPASLYRMLESAPTLLLDENEPLNGKNKSEATQILIAALNAGHRKGATIPRCDGPRQEVRHFKVYGPKLLAGIGKLPDTLTDRSIRIQMQRRSKDQKVARFRQARAKAEAQPIHDAAVRFVKAHSDEIQNAYAASLEKDLEFLNDRDADVWTPLFVLCSVAAPERLAELEKCARTLSAAKADDDLDDSLSLTLLRDIQTVWPAGEEKCATSVLLALLNVLEDSAWIEHPLTARKLAEILKPFEVAPRGVRTGQKTPKGYLYTDLKDAFGRYLEEKSATCATEQ